MIRRCILLGILLTSVAFTEEVTPPTSEEAIIERLQDPDGVSFAPPEGWQFLEPKALPPHVKVMAVGKGKGEFPPSINLGYDKYDGNIKNYLKLIKSLNKEDGVETKDLGKVKTDAGSAALLQIDTKTKWGNERQLQAIVLFNGKAWILTCSALKKEFPTYYKTFFDAIRSMKMNKPS